MSTKLRISPSGKPKIFVLTTAAIDAANVPPETAPDQAMAVTGAKVGDALLALPNGDWDEGLIVGPSRCLVAGTVQVRIANETSGTIDPDSQTYSFLIFRNGTVRLSPSGPIKIYNQDVTVNFDPIPDVTADDYVVNVSRAQVGDFIIVTPLGTWDAGLVMGPHRCTTDGEVLVRIGNVTVGGPIDPASQGYRFTLIRPRRKGRASPSGPARIAQKTVTVDVANILTKTAPDTAVVVPGVETGDTIIATPLGVWPVGLSIGPNRCLVDGTVQMRVGNVTLGAVDPVSQSFKFTLIKAA
jgi:hypothetical protein